MTVKVHADPTRCPYCHDDCGPGDGVACNSCLARHHGDCWGELGACSSCGHTISLTSVVREATAVQPVDALPIGRDYPVSYKTTAVNYQFLNVSFQCPVVNSDFEYEAVGFEVDGPLDPDSEVEVYFNNLNHMMRIPAVLAQRSGGYRFSARMRPLRGALVSVRAAAGALHGSARITFVLHGRIVVA